MPFDGKTHRPESNQQRSESMRKLYLEARPDGMGFKRKYNTPEEAAEGKRLLERQRSLRHLYGMDLEDYDAVSDAQGGRCAICGATSGVASRPGSWLHVDHDHETGEVRGLLCTMCNKSLGFVETTGFQVLWAYLSDPPARGVLPRAGRAAA